MLIRHCIARPKKRTYRHAAEYKFSVADVPAAGDSDLRVDGVKGGHDLSTVCSTWMRD